jgi:hypothetical protein
VGLTREQVAHITDPNPAVFGDRDEMIPVDFAVNLHWWLPNINGVTRFAQALLDEGGDPRFILNGEDTHTHGPNRNYPIVKRTLRATSVSVRSRSVDHGSASLPGTTPFGSDSMC